MDTTTTEATLQEPVEGCIAWAKTLTPTGQRVRVMVSMVEEETDSGWIVWGYRVYQSARRRARTTAYPTRYAVARGALILPPDRGRLYAELSQGVTPRFSPE